MSAPQCYAVSDVTAEETRALKAIKAGAATEHQQRLAAAVIIKKFARTHDEPFIEGSSDGTAFLAGRGFVGRRILLHFEQPFSVLHPDEKEVLND